MTNGDISFSLSEKFIDSYKHKKPNFGPLGLFTFKRTYARTLPNGKTEEWWQTVQRVVEGCFLVQKQHCFGLKLPWNERKAQKSSQEMYERIFKFKFLPPGRGLWAMGSDFMFKKGSACLYNCGFISTKDIDSNFSLPFIWLMDMSLLGVGVGFDTRGAEKEVYLKAPRRTKEVHLVADSREGWTDVFQRILDAYSGKDSMPETFDYSLIRPAGSPIKGFGGIAPGPGPLIELADRTVVALDKYIKEDKPVDSTLIVDLMNFAGAAVVAGGIRRTAEIAFGELADSEFLKLKETENLENPSLARWASNNSLFVKKGDDYSEVALQTAKNGEPGYMWLDNARRYGRMKEEPNNRDYRVAGSNPCGEISLEHGELCNICETFPSRHDTLEDYLRTLKYAFMYCKTVTLIPTHNDLTNQVQMRNRRIGISQSGIVENINKLGFRKHIKWCDAGYDEIKKWDTVYSEWFCIPRSIKITTVKPSGTVSLLPGVTPGIHYPHSEYYIRRVRVAKTSDIWAIMEKAGYMVEPDVNQPDYTMIVSFPVHEPNFSRRKVDVSMWEQFELAAQMQAYWSDNQVSITITVNSEEFKDLGRALSMYESRLKSVSILPLADHNYAQAPYEEITKERYEELTTGLKQPKLSVTENDSGKETEKFCDGDFCEV